MEKDEFVNHINSIYGHGMIILAMGIGHDLGLFKVLLETDQPISVKEVAEKLGLKERYTREWLSCMVSARIIHQDRDTNLYIVPDTHRDTLKNKTAFSAGIFPFCARGEKVKVCFRKDGPSGLGYHESPEWFDWFDTHRSQTLVSVLDTEIIPKLTQQGFIPKLESGIRVLDLGCGTGSYTNGLAKRFPNSHFIGLEYAERGLKIARQKCDEQGLTNSSFEFGDAHNLPEKWTNYFDWVFVFDVLHDLPDPHKALTQIYRVMKDDGCFSLVEGNFHSNPVDNIGNAMAAMHYSLSMMGCLPSSMLTEPYVGYGACWGVEEIEKALKGQKFKIEKQSTMFETATKAFYFCTKESNIGKKFRVEKEDY